MATKEDTIRATVRALRARPPDGLDDVSADGTLGVRVVEIDLAPDLYGRTFRPTNGGSTRPATSGNRRPAASPRQWSPSTPGNELRLECCRGSRTGRQTLRRTADQPVSRPVATAVVAESMTVACASPSPMPWTREHAPTPSGVLERQRASPGRTRAARPRTRSRPEVKVIVRPGRSRERRPRRLDHRSGGPMPLSSTRARRRRRSAGPSLRGKRREPDTARRRRPGRLRQFPDTGRRPCTLRTPYRAASRRRPATP